MRGLVRVIAAGIGTALAVAGCGTDSAPTASDEVGPPRLALPDVTPTLYVLPVHGTATPWYLNGEVALELQRFDIAASTAGANGASYHLYSLAEAQPTAPDKVDVTFYWDLVDPRGELIGTVSHVEPMTLAEWRGLPDDVPRIAVEAASRIINIVPGAGWDPVDPAMRLAAMEERRKLEERRRLYRKMASRGGLGPLSQRIFVHAEKEERRARATRVQLQADAASSGTAPEAAPSESAADGEPAAATPDEPGLPPYPEPADTVVANRVDGAGPPPPSGSVPEPGLWAELGIFPDEADARSHWLRLRFRHAALFADRRVKVIPVAMADRGTFYRVEAGPFAAPVEAMGFCLELQAARVECVTPALIENPPTTAETTDAGPLPADRDSNPAAPAVPRAPTAGR